eukprot:CAMPEP_0182831120 /NCGR_PEP_ID=MMETSP0006_2-20121128/18947_1 /TAXON_ID=97485 /ORGANISM="Prymnesium parvum, Strain Texoma1" /LENGTH=180 /DNA_ID=CAMNT_0024958749 /DNA_START=385 /DNA_END=927 /DNA_ORIENTATION=+
MVHSNRAVVVEDDTDDEEDQKRLMLEATRLKTLLDALRGQKAYLEQAVRTQTDALAGIIPMMERVGVNGKCCKRSAPDMSRSPSSNSTDDIDLEDVGPVVVYRSLDDDEDEALFGALDADSLRSQVSGIVSHLEQQLARHDREHGPASAKELAMELQKAVEQLQKLFGGAVLDDASDELP